MKGFLRSLPGVGRLSEWISIFVWVLVLWLTWRGEDLESALSTAEIVG